jgi:GNAT superfamily N-acetyltransferase
MSISFSEVHHPDEFINRELRVMARHSTKTSRTTWYRACRDGEEVAFLAIGLSGEHLFPYQLVVPRELRGRGIGSAVLCAVERLAQSEGFERVRVWPRPLDDSLDQWRLERAASCRLIQSIASSTKSTLRLQPWSGRFGGSTGVVPRYS